MSLQMINTYPVLPHYIMNTDKISQNIFTYISQLSFWRYFLKKVSDRLLRKNSKSPRQFIYFFKEYD